MKLEGLSVRNVVQQTALSFSGLRVATEHWAFIAD
jgi:hypothetical protein